MAMNLRGLAMVLPGAVLWLVASAGVVHAECFPPPDDFPRPRFAFTATVQEVSNRVAPAPDMADFDWHLVLDVEHRYRGSVPDQLVANGWDQGCDWTGVRVHEGDRLLVATQRVDPTTRG
jgi:hypothetical protein